MCRSLLPAILFLTFLILAGCKDKSSGEFGYLGEFINNPQTPPSGLDGKYNMAADTNRDGAVDTEGSDDYGENVWNAAQGAVMAYNNDDDNSDSDRDHNDSLVNGVSDESDLARVVIKQIADIETGSYAKIALDADSADCVRLFKNNGASWSVFNPATDTITSGELASGDVIFGIESRKYSETASGEPGLWSGTATLTLTVYEQGGAVSGTDSLLVRTAPFIMNTNLDSPERIYVCNSGDNAGFVSDLTTIAGTIGLPITVISYTECGGDRWTQDQFEFGSAEMSSDVTPVVLNSPRDRSTLADYPWYYLLGPDFGCLQQSGNTMESLNSFGNLECIPPYGSYPLGRIIVGGAGTRRMDESVRNFLSAQSMQGPVYELDTTWLAVGHVDEIMSFIPAPNARGWVVAWADVDVALDMLEVVPASTPVFQGTGAATTASVILNDSSLIAFNESVQTNCLDVLRGRLKADLGLSESDFVRIPVLWDVEYSPDARALAYTAGAVNWIVIGSHVIVARQFGPEVGGTDKFEEDITNKLFALGLTAHFIDDWDTYHELWGEVHCGTNVLRTLPSSPKWWTTGR